MRWKSLLTCCKASMCSTAQSPRARKAFSRACAARTCPAPDVADSNNTRGFVFICGEFLRRQAASGCLALSRGDFLQDASRDFLQIPEPHQVILKIVIQELRFLGAQLRPQNHVTQFYGMRKQCLFLQFLERNLGVVVIHGFPQRKNTSTVLYSVIDTRGSHPKTGREKKALRSGRRGRHEFVARDFRGNAHPAVLGGLDTHNLSQAADIYIARLIDLLWERNDELDLAANFEIGLSKEVEPSVTDIPRVRVQLASLGFSWQIPHGKTHRESPRLAAFRSITHQYPLGAWDLAQR